METPLYTRNGDNGQTRLGAGRRVPKTNGTLEVLGNIDELSSCLGLVKAYLSEDEPDLVKEISDVQQQLLRLKEDLGSFGGLRQISQKDVDVLEARIDAYAPYAQIKDPKLIPGATMGSAQLDIARGIARRTERSLSKAGLPSSVHQKYLNRLPDYLYAAARYMDLKESIAGQVRSQIFGSAEKAPVKAPVSDKPLPLPLAKKLIDAIEEEGYRRGISFVIAVADDAGRPIAVHVMDDAFIASYDIAVNKAFTAVALKMDTKELVDLCQPGGSLYGLQNTNDGRIVIFGGGVTLTDRNGRIIGGLGVSGSTAEIDTEMGDIGKALFETMRP